MAPSESSKFLSRWGDLLQELRSHYFSTTSRKLQLIDFFIVISLMFAVLPTIYAFISNRYPYNSFLAAVFCSVGHAVLLICLRLQVANPKDFGNITAESAFAGFLIGDLFLFFIVSTFIG